MTGGGFEAVVSVGRADPAGVGLRREASLHPVTGSVLKDHPLEGEIARTPPPRTTRW